MSLQYLHICENYKPLTDCLCNIFQQEQIPANFKVRVESLQNTIKQMRGPVKNIIEQLNVPSLWTLTGEPCDDLRSLFEQIGAICTHLQNDSQTANAVVNLEELDQLLKKISEDFQVIKNEFQAAGIFICQASSVHSKIIRLQSKYLYLQAAGSDGADGISKGSHLRWTFGKELVKEHLPKGDLAMSDDYYTQDGHNRADDFVYIHRIAYDRSKSPVVDFSKAPASVTNVYGKKIWEYKVPGYGTNIVSVMIQFMDPLMYDAIAIDMNSQPQNFLNAYKGVIHIFVKDSLMFGAAVTFKALPRGCASFFTNGTVPESTLQVQIISAEHNDPGAAMRLVCRKKYTVSNRNLHTENISCENIKYLQIKCDKTILSKIKIESYQDVYNSVPEPALIGKYSLTLQNDEAYRRLEDRTRFEIDQLWPRYNGDEKTSVNNYKNKWANHSDGIKEAVKKYLKLSTQNVSAKDTLVVNNGENTISMPVSYLDILNLIGSDFHIARMLGLGHIDVPASEAPDGYIYTATYYGKKNLLYKDEPLQTEYIGLVWMSLPTKFTDYRLPETPVMRELRYGANVNGGINLLSDINGYSNYYDVRFVNIGREKYDYEKHSGSLVFFGNDQEFCICQNTQSILYGIEYKKSGEATYRSPEITSFTNQEEANNAETETVLIPDNPDLFVHTETEEGVHCYALYGVNWFSRASPTSAPQCTDETSFPKKNTLKAPSNLAVQYIQSEETLIFTSQQEQDMLAQRESETPGADNCFTRVTFQYDHTHNIAYQKGRKVRFYFRQELPLEVRGKIKGILKTDADIFLCDLELVSYASVEEPGALIEPKIPVELSHRFIGGVLHTDEEQFIVKEIKPGNPYPVITVEYLVSRKMNAETDKDEEGVEITTYKNAGELILPQTGRFSLIENLASDAQWVRLNKQVDLIDFSDYTEEINDEEGNREVMTIGGITGNAEIRSHRSLVNPDNSEEKEEDVLEGVYKISFQNVILPGHSDKDVSWHKGTVRIPGSAPSENKILEVMSIESQNPLVIWVYDPDSGENPVLNVQHTNVNFHPGYKVYLYPEPSNGFDSLLIKPLSGHTRKTLMGVQSVDTSNTPELRSSVSVPAVLLSQKIDEPVQPDTPKGVDFATRPDFYGKSTYTFDIDTRNRTPFGYIFFRADDTAILNALYKPDTIKNEIEQNLLSDIFIANRFRDLIDISADSFDDGKFREYGGYRLPDPDKYPLLETIEIEKKIDEIRKAIDRIFIPLTQHPPLYDFIKTGNHTESSPPRIKDTQGMLLEPEDADPFPMVRKFTEDGKTYVRFTDYTLDGASVNMFFYCAAEISSRLKMSRRSSVKGPVRLINSFAPEAPFVKGIFPQTANPVQGTKTFVTFLTGEYSVHEAVEKINIFRTLDINETRTVRTMKLVATCDQNNIKDKFEDLKLPPYGEVIYYRLVALRRIVNEEGKEEWVPSKASELFMTNLIDVINPDAPALEYRYGAIEGHTLSEVELHWKPTCYNGTYHLLRMSNKGNWEKIYSVKSNVDMIFPPVKDYEIFPQTKQLLKKDPDQPDKMIYHHFKIEVVNASGLRNLTSKEKSI